MNNLSPEEAIAILSDMKIDIPIPKAAVTQIKRNIALDMAISALRCSEIPNSSDTISRQEVTDTVRKIILGFFSDSDKDGAMNDTEKTLLSVSKAICNGVRELPSAQPEIVRCKECIMHGVCRFELGLGLDGYCSQAERRTDE